MARTQASNRKGTEADSNSSGIEQFEIGYTTDRSCELSNLLADYPKILGFFTDSDCENGTNAYARDTDNTYYYLCDFHLGQLIRGQQVNLPAIKYTQNNPNASWNLPK